VRFAIDVQQRFVEHPWDWPAMDEFYGHGGEGVVSVFFFRKGNCVPDHRRLSGGDRKDF